MDQLDDQGLLFNVTEDKLLTASGIEVPKKKAIIHQSGEVISVVGENYKVVSNEEIFSSFCRGIEESNIDAADAKVDVTQTDTGSKAMVTFTMPNVSFKVSDDESDTVMQICTLNSFDGTTRFISKAGGLRAKCLNGQILGNVVSSYSRYHTKSLDVDAAAGGIINMIVDFQNAKEYWAAMMQQYVSGEHAAEVFKKFLYLENYDFTNLVNKPNKRFELCMSMWNAYSQEFGSNAYALYNVLTDYVSRSDLSAAGEIRERNHVAKLLDTEAAFHEARQAA
jgi:hypothetical protein